MKNKNVKQFFALGMAILMVGSIFVGCAPTKTSPPVSECSHTFSNKWSSDETAHWHVSACGHDVTGDKAEHTFNSTGTCTVCGYHTHVYAATWISDGKTHWHAALCGHDVKGDEAEHTLNSGKTACSICSRGVIDHARKPVSSEHFKDSYEIGNTRIQLLSETLVRIEGKLNGKFENRESYIVTNRLDWEGIQGKKITENSVTKIKTEKYTVVVPNSGTNAQETYIVDAAGGTIWNYSGETDTNVYIPSPSDELKSWYFTDSPRIIPSYEGYSTGAKNALQGWDFSGRAATDIFVFLPDGDYERFCTDYVNLTGKTEMVNLSTLGFWDSRYYAYTQETALQQIRDYRSRGYAIDVLVIDTDWRKSTGNTAGMGYDINTSLFPNMANFLKECKALGVEVCFNDHPTPVNNTTSGLDKAEVDYRNEKLTLLLSLGVDYWWYDRNWSTSLNSFDSEISVYAFGMYAYEWITEDYYNKIADVFEYARRAVIMGNVDGVLNGEWKYASDISAHRYSIQWTGDTWSGSDDLAQEIYTAVLGGAEVGIPYMSSDLGGHNGNLSEAEYVRWIQYGMLSAIARVHCVNSQPGRMPWVYGSKAEEVFKVYQDMRYRLLPLYYNLARENYDTGLPIMRRVDVKYPQYAEASRNDEYLLGDYILVAPLKTQSNPLEAQKKKPIALFTHEEDGVDKKGLVGAYIDSNRFSVNPKATRIDEDIDFDWGTGKAHEAMEKADNFSVKWTGFINIGSVAARLAFIADDSVKVIIDGKETFSGNDATKYYMTARYEANSRHTIEVRYQDLEGEAFIHSFYLEEPTQSACYTSRDVFFPEGTWIDVWTGKRYCGPNTYGVSYPLESSPVFVREGALVVLANNGKSTGATDWGELTLDVYPSVNYTAKTRLYEDDTNTVAYKYGKYRTTDVTMNFDGNKSAVVVTIDGAKGEFDGVKSFDKRLWNIRVHKNIGWGNLTNVVINGIALSQEAIDKHTASNAAKPFALSGAAPDGDIYEFGVEGSVRQKYIIELYFDITTVSQKSEDYDAAATDFALTAVGAVTAVNLSQSGDIDWVSYGDDGTAKANGNARDVFGYPETRTVGSGRPACSTQTSIASCSGSVNKTYTFGGNSANSSSAVYTNQFFDFEIHTVGQKAEYVLILGGKNSTAKVTVRDRAGNVKTIYFGSLSGEWTQKIVIATSASADGTLYVNFSAVATSKRDSGGYANEALLESEEALKLYGCYAQSK